MAVERIRRFSRKSPKLSWPKQIREDSSSERGVQPRTVGLFPQLGSGRRQLCTNEALMTRPHACSHVVILKQIGGNQQSHGLVPLVSDGSATDHRLPGTGEWIKPPHSASKRPELK